MSAIVVTDAGPLHYLVLIDCADILPILFEHVLVPFAVRDAMSRSTRLAGFQIVQHSPDAVDLSTFHNLERG